MSFPGLPDFRTVNSEEQAQIVLTMHHLNLRILRGAHISGHVSSGKSSALFLRVAAAAASPLLRSSSSNRASSTPQKQNPQQLEQQLHMQHQQQQARPVVCLFGVFQIGDLLGRAFNSGSWRKSIV